VAGGKPLAGSGGMFTRLFAGRIDPILAQIDKGLAEGSLLAHFPGGVSRMLGGRGAGPAAEITVHDWRALLRLVARRSVGCYQGYEARDWSSPDPVQVFTLFVRNAASLGQTARAKGPWRIAARLLHILRRNSRKGAALNIAAHYDLGNDFYALWLDPTMSYSSACWQGLPLDAALEAAQRNKVDLLAERLALKPGDKVLEIGCGWGYMAARMAEQHGVGVHCHQPLRTAVRMVPHARRGQQDFWPRMPPSGLPRCHRHLRCHRQRRNGRGGGPRLVAVLSGYHRPCAEARRPRGAAVYRDPRRPVRSLCPQRRFHSGLCLPGGMLLSESEFRRLAATRGLEWTEQQDFPADYARTLRLWREAFDAAVEGGRFAGFDERFVRLWRFYLMYCEAGFLGGGITVSQVTLRKSI